MTAKFKISFIAGSDLIDFANIDEAIKFITPSIGDVVKSIHFPESDGLIVTNVKDSIVCGYEVGAAMPVRRDWKYTDQGFRILSIENILK